MKTLFAIFCFCAALLPLSRGEDHPVENLRPTGDLTGLLNAVGAPLRAITSVGDGAAGSLEAVPTTKLAVPARRTIYLPGTGELQDWLLVSGTSATAAGQVQRPNDYNAATNARVWLRKSVLPTGVITADPTTHALTSMTADQFRTGNGFAAAATLSVGTTAGTVAAGDAAQAAFDLAVANDLIGQYNNQALSFAAGGQNYDGSNGYAFSLASTNVTELDFSRVTMVIYPSASDNPVDDILQACITAGVSNATINVNGPYTPAPTLDVGSTAVSWTVTVTSGDFSGSAAGSSFDLEDDEGTAAAFYITVNGVGSGTGTAVNVASNATGQDIADALAAASGVSDNGGLTLDFGIRSYAVQTAGENASGVFSVNADQSAPYSSLKATLESAGNTVNTN